MSKKGKEVIAGVYQIINTVNNKKYIGSSIDIYKRWNDHLKALRSNTHHSTYLQNSWNKYGENNFVFEVIEQCELLQNENNIGFIERLRSLEQFYLDKYQTYNSDYGYNMSSKAIGVGASFTSFQEDKRLISYEQFMYILDQLQNTDRIFADIARDIFGNNQDIHLMNNTIGEIYHRKKFSQLTSNLVFKERITRMQYIDEQYGEQIKQLVMLGYRNIDIAEELDLFVNEVARYTKEYHLYPSRIKDIYIYDINNNLLQICHGGIEAELYTGIPKGRITESCRKNSKRVAGKYRFSYQKLEDNDGK